MVYRLVVVVVVMMLAGCQTVPSNRSVLVSPEAQTKMSRIGRVGIIADVCFFQDNLGDDDYWTIEESRMAGGYMLDAAKSYLGGKGYDVTYARMPFVGAFKNKEVLFKVSDGGGPGVREQNPPFFEADDVFKDNHAYREALLKAVPRILSDYRKASGDPDPEMKSCIGRIADVTGADATLFLIGHGTIVSTGKQLVEGITTGLLTAALTLGTVSVSSYHVSFMNSYAVLVDNGTGNILWSNAMGHKGDGFTSAGYYDAEKWPKKILYHFPARADSGLSGENVRVVEGKRLDPDGDSSLVDDSIKPDMAGEDAGRK